MKWTIEYTVQKQSFYRPRPTCNSHKQQIVPAHSWTLNMFQNCSVWSSHHGLLDVMSVFNECNTTEFPDNVGK